MRNSTKSALVQVSIANTTLPHTAGLERSEPPLSPVISWRAITLMLISLPVLWLCRSLVGW